MLKKLLLASLILIAQQSFASDFYIKGKVTDLKTAKEKWLPKVYLLKINRLDQLLNGSAQNLVDSAVIKPNGSFEFHNDAVIENNCFYRLNVITREREGNGGAIYMMGTTEALAFLLLNKNARIEFTTLLAKFDDALQPLKMDATNMAIRSLYEIRHRANLVTDTLVAERNALDTAASNYKEQVNNINGRLRGTLMNNAIYIALFSDTVKDPYASILATQFYPPVDSEFSKRLSDRYHNEIPTSKYTPQYDAWIKQTTYELPIGSIAPEISLPDNHGKIMKLSQLKGNYVLVNFWASWCHPCRQEITYTIKPLYQKYSAKGFKVFSVSQDIHKGQWLEAIRKDSSESFIQVSDLKGNMSKTAEDYRIQSLPASFIIDPKGRIVAKNLRGDELEKFMKENIK